MCINNKNLRKIILDEVSALIENGRIRDPVPLSQEQVLQEDFTRSEKQELSRIIRNELARIFYDLFKKRNFWT